LSPYDLEHPIAKDIMTPLVYSISSQENFSSAIQSMVEKRISALLVNHETQYFIITYRDIAACLYNNRNSPKNLDDIKIVDWMKGPVDLLDENTPIDSVIHYLFKHGYRLAIIGKQGVPTGVVSISDILMWTDIYFKPSKPLVFALIHNPSSILIGSYIFKENLEGDINNGKIKHGVNQDLLDLFGGALQSVSQILEEIVDQSGYVRELEKESYVITFERREFITGILFSDKKSIDMRHRLHQVTNLFCERYGREIQSWNENIGIQTIDLTDLAQFF
jgi:CBS domain-containing protein